MALNKITYTDKVALSPQPSVAAVNKVSDSDMNEIKSVVNDAIDKIESPQTTRTTSDTDTYSCNYINDMNEYSTSEINTGKKWIDNKPIYRKCFLKTTSTNIQTGNTTISSGFTAGLDTILSMVGTVNLGGTYYACISKDWNTLIDGNGDLMMTGLGVARTFSRIAIVVEYTKTTD
jgi:hypothetical protein